VPEIRDPQNIELNPFCQPFNDYPQSFNDYLLMTHTPAKFQRFPVTTLTENGRILSNHHQNNLLQNNKIAPLKRNNGLCTSFSGKTKTIY